MINKDKFVLENKNQKLKILGKTFEILRADTFYKKHAWGEIDYLNQTIEIENSLSEDKFKETLLHEILHAILESLGFDELNEDEHLIQCLANSLHQVLKENNNLLV